MVSVISRRLAWKNAEKSAVYASLSFAGTRIAIRIEGTGSSGSAANREAETIDQEKQSVTID